MVKQWYKEDLAYIHDVGFSDRALKSVPAILEILAQQQISQGLIVELGCGSGLSAQKLTLANYGVLGIDISEPLIAIARARVPQAEFRIGSFYQAEIPPCSAVISIGECLNYLFDPDNSDRSNLVSLFRRIYSALIPGGILIFDIAEPGQVAPNATTRNFTAGEDWVVLVEKEENRESKILTRRIILFRKLGKFYRRDDEIHRQQLYRAAEIEQELHRVGFQVRVTRSYGSYNLPQPSAVLIARKAS